MVNIISYFSCLSPADYIELKSSLKSIDDQEFNCNFCLKKYSNRPDHAEMTKANRERKGCFNISQNALHNIDNLRYHSCIGNFVSDSAISFVEAEARYNQGILPYAGSLFDQPAKVMEIFSCIAVWKQDRLNRLKKAQALKERSFNGRRNSHPPIRRR